MDVALKIIPWPVPLCLYLSGPGPSVGPPEKHYHEGTPIQLIAVAIGLFFAFLFWSGGLCYRAWLETMR